MIPATVIITTISNLQTHPYIVPARKQPALNSLFAHQLKKNIERFTKTTALILTDGKAFSHPIWGNSTSC